MVIYQKLKLSNISLYKIRPPGMTVVGTPECATTYKEIFIYMSIENHIQTRLISFI